MDDVRALPLSPADLAPEPPDGTRCQAAAAMCSPTDVSWLLGRAAQRIAAIVDAEAARHGTGMRGQLVLTALAQESGRTQLALGAALHVDKTTLTTELDRLEAGGFVRRCPDPKDRRVRIPAITDAGRILQLTVAQAITAVVDDELAILSPAERATLEDSLRRIVERPGVKGSARGGCAPCDPVS